MTRTRGTFQSAWFVACIGITTTLCILAQGARSLQAADWELEKIDGTRIRFESFELAATSVRYRERGETQELANNEIKRIRRAGALGAPSKLRLGLVDGSELAIDAIEGKSDQWKVVSNETEALVGKGLAKWLLFRSPTGKESTAWKEFLEGKQDSDILVIARDEGVLDRANGIVNAIVPPSVQFDFDGQAIEAPIAKLLGLIWLRTNATRIEPTLKVCLTDGTTWMAREVRLPENNTTDVTGTATCGLPIRFPLLSLYEIDFSIANLKWLSQTELLESKGSASTLVKNNPLRDTVFRPHFSVSNGIAESLDQDLDFKVPGEASFRIPKGVARFASSIMRTSEGDVRSELSLEIWVQDKKVWESKMDPNQEVVRVDVPVEVDKRMKLVVRSTSALPAGCEVKWVQPRFLR
ncbi:MAG: hypothetical protein U0905_04525 [Pirellulales bacterium]